MRSMTILFFIFLGAFSGQTLPQTTPGFWAGDFSMPRGCSWHVLYMDATADGKVYLILQGNVCGENSGTLFFYDPVEDDFGAVGEFSRADDGNPAVTSIRSDGNDLYVGGSFSHIDGLEVNGIARLDTSTNTWSALGTSGAAGITDGAWVRDILITGTDVYAAGTFLEMGGVATPGIARYDRNQGQWHGLGIGLTSQNAQARSLARTDDGTIYVGGIFSEAGGISASNIAAWDGSDWSALGEGINSTVFTLAANGTTLYAGGQFTQAGGQNIGHLAAWDGNDWSSPISDVQTDSIFFGPKISVLRVSDGFLYAGGFFDSIDGIPTQDLARMDLATGQWHSIEDGAGEGLGRGAMGLIFSRGVESMALVDSKLYVGGNLTRAGGQPINNIASFDLLDEQWSVLGSGTGQGVSSQDVWTVEHTPQGVLALGPIGQTGLLRANGIARRKLAEDAWSGFANNDMQALISTVTQVAFVDDDMFVGGSFVLLMEDPDNPSLVQTISRIARWDAGAAAWEPLVDADTDTQGVSAGVQALAEYEGDLVAVGSFTSAGGKTVNGIARWNRSSETWTAFGDGLDAGANALAIGPNGKIYVGGGFETAGGEPANRVAMWDPVTETWSSLGDGIATSDDDIPALVQALAVTDDGDLLVGGRFDLAGTASVNSLARWDGTAWHDVGGGVIDEQGAPGLVRSIVTAESGEIFIGGQFVQAGSLAANSLARWHESEWSLVGPGSDENGVESPSTATVFDLALKGPDLMVGGNFSRAGGQVAANFAHFVRDLGGSELDVSIDVEELAGTSNGDTELLGIQTGSSGLLYIIEVRNLGMNSAYGVEFKVTADPEPNSVEWTCEPLAGTEAVCPQTMGSGLPDLVFNLPQQSGLRFELLASIDSEDPYTQEVGASANSQPTLDGDKTSSESSSIKVVNDLIFDDRFQ